MTFKCMQQIFMVSQIFGPDRNQCGPDSSVFNLVNLIPWFDLSTVTVKYNLIIKDKKKDDRQPRTELPE